MASSNADEREILNKLGEFARILDGRRWQDVSEIFSTNISFNYGDGQEQEGIDELTRNFKTYLDPCGPSQHLLGSIQLELGAKEAVTRSYVQARHQGAGDKSDLYFDSNGEYIDRWQREDAGWRIIRRDVQWAMLKGDMSVLSAE
ncbi:MAG: nuclear transport factor 2 family protein [Pseudomonadales bacterium]